MAAPLYNEIIEYDDGTPATQSQLAHFGPVSMSTLHIRGQRSQASGQALRNDAQNGSEVLERARGHHEQLRRRHPQEVRDPGVEQGALPVVQKHLQREVHAFASFVRLSLP